MISVGSSFALLGLGSFQLYHERRSKMLPIVRTLVTNCGTYAPASLRYGVAYQRHWCESNQSDEVELAKTFLTAGSTLQIMLCYLTGARQEFHLLGRKAIPPSSSSTSSGLKMFTKPKTHFTSLASKLRFSTDQVNGDDWFEDHGGNNLESTMYSLPKVRILV